MPQTVLLRADVSPALEGKSALAGELRSDVRRTWVRLGKEGEIRLRRRLNGEKVLSPR
jgi:hypothetical protein